MVVTEELLIAPATYGDLAELVVLYPHLIEDEPPLDLELAQQRLRQIELYPGSAVFVAKQVGTVVSSATLIVVPNFTRGGAPYALIENVVTHKDYRGKGFGAQVMQHAIQSAWQNGCYKVMLLTGRTDPAVLRFYEGLGFARTKTGLQIRRP